MKINFFKNNKEIQAAIDESADRIYKKQRFQVKLLGVKNIFNKASNNFFGFNISSNEFNVNIDKHLKRISKAKKNDGYVRRSSSNLRMKSMADGYQFIGNVKVLKRVKKEFEKRINLFDSNIDSFIRDILSGIIDYANVYINRIESKKFGVGYYIMPSLGWTVKEKLGYEAVSWTYDSQDIFNKEFSYKKIFHLTYNKEKHEIFGTPMLLAGLDDVQILRDLEDASASDYINSTNKKIMFKVGTDQMPGSEKDIEELQAYLNSTDPDDDYIFTNRVTTDVLSYDFKEPGSVLENARKRAFSTISSSESGMGFAAMGRQESETQSEEENLLIEDIKTAIAQEINIKILKDVVFDLYGYVSLDNMVTIQFNKNFGLQEKIEKHTMALFQSGIIDFDEMRTLIGRKDKSFDKSKTFQEMYGNKNNEKNINANQNKTDPENQYGKRGTSKKSKKN